MMKKLVYCTAWFAIWLLLTIPVALSQQILTIQKFSGVDNVNGFAKQGDELTVQLLAEMLGSPSPEVARQRARVYYGDTYSFMDSCAAQSGNYYQCMYKTADIVYGGTDDYTIKLFSPDNAEIASVDKTLTVDTLAPKVVSFSVSPNMTTTAVATTVTYAVEDYGAQTGQATECAGIKLLNITANTTQVASISTNAGTCTKEGTVVFTPSVSGQSARVTVCAVATDYVNHKSLPVCKDILIDSRKPTATALELRDSDGFLITHARSTQPVIADVFVNIPDVDIDPATVYADLSKLNPELGKLVRQDQSGPFFIWRNVQITTPATCQVTVEAADLMGNTDTKTLTCSIGVDDAAPVPTEIATQFVDDDGVPILGVNGTITARFTEAGSGLDKANAFMDLRGLGLGAEVKANACEKTGADAWKCSWNVKPTVESGMATVKVLPTTRDDLDNQMTGTFERQIRFDNTAPSGVLLKEIAAFRGQVRVKTNVTSLGETLEFVVEGAGFKNATADFRSLGGSMTTLAERCTGNLTKTCTFSVTTAVSGPQGTNITFTFMDIAGNKATFSTSELFILGIANETAPNYWNVSTECSPTLLDRKTLSVFEHPVYCRLRMTSTNPQAQPITVEGPADFTQCTGQTDYISDLSIENNFAGSTEPYMALSLVATDYAINSLTFTCPISTFTRVGNFMPQNTERDNATITLQFYDLPLGELYENIDNEIKDVEDKIGGVWDIIGTMQKFMGYAEMFCKILHVVISIISTVTQIMFLLNVSAATAEKIPFVGPSIAQTIERTTSAACSPTETLRNEFNKEGGLLSTFMKFCNFLTCQTGLFDVIGTAGLDIVDVKPGDVDLAGDWFYKMLDPADLGGTLGKSVKDLVAQPNSTAQNPASYLNVKDSLIYSIIIPPLCIPGIIYNLDKWRQIECRYGLCLLEDVRENGMPVSACKDQKSYMQCRFVVGEIFNIIPFAPIVNYYLNMFQQALSDPLVLAGIGISIILNCNKACLVGKDVGWTYYACAGMSITSQLGQSISTIKNLKKDFGSIGNQWCEDFEDALDDYGG